MRAAMGKGLRLSRARDLARPTTRARRARAAHHATPTRAFFSLGAAPVGALVGGGALVVGAAGALAWAALGFANRPAAAQPDGEPAARRDAVLVLGATGRSGRAIVAALLRSGRTVVAAVRDAARADAVFSELGLPAGPQPGGRGALFVEAGVDVTDPTTLGPRLFEGVSQVVLSMGAVFGRTPDGAMGYLDGMTPERVDAAGVAAAAAAAAAALPRPAGAPAAGREGPVELLPLEPMATPDDLARWQRLDDVIMGGSSSSALAPAADGSGHAVWSGALVVEGGGFCGARTLPLPGGGARDLSAYDGLRLRVSCPQGHTFKLNVKTDALSEPEDVYQATFDTPPGGAWADVYLPWHAFVPVKRARSVPGGAPIDAATVRQFGLVLSRFDFNGAANARHAPGPFELRIDGGIAAYREPRPALLLVSSAGVERNAVVGDDAEARKREIPIVALNPGGILNWKYEGEAAVRASGLPYCVVRPVGLTDEAEGGPWLLEAGQGDVLTGKLGRAELAAVVAAALRSPAAAGKTFEVRRAEAADARGPGRDGTDGTRLARLFLPLAPDRTRTRAGLPPFLAPVPPPPPPGKARVAEILADPRVRASAAAGRGGRVRSEAESAAAGGVTPAPGAAAAAPEREAVGAKA